jgi:hypothetical protein
MLNKRTSRLAVKKKKNFLQLVAVHAEHSSSAVRLAGCWWLMLICSERKNITG